MKDVNDLIIKSNKLGVQEGKNLILEKCCNKCYEKLKQEKMKGR